MTTELSVALQGRNGNVLFQLCNLYVLAKKTGIKPIIYTQFITNSSSSSFVKWKDVFESFFSFKTKCNNPINWINEDSTKPCVYFDATVFIKKDYTNVLRGYFQSAKFFDGYENEIRALILNTINYDINLNGVFSFNSSLHTINCTDSGYFIHIRGGDYVNNAFHNLNNLELYYSLSVDKIGLDKQYYLFTNDIEYTKQFQFFNKLQKKVILINENEKFCLKFMSECQGGICPNSSFSWWGAWLNNKKDKTILMPYRWFPHDKLEYQDIYFDGVTKITF